MSNQIPPNNNDEPIHTPPLSTFAPNKAKLYYIVTCIEFFALAFVYIIMVEVARPFRQHAEYYTATVITIAAILFSIYTFLIAHKTFPESDAKTMRIIHLILLGLFAFPLLVLLNFYFHYTYADWFFPNWPPKINLN
ncbi:hypothetical protein JD969_06315 [Planctomycetota bacterium]|nr:hypothetical protein JD969_06315 [Planctomycetota bacterium]